MLSFSTSVTVYLRCIQGGFKLQLFKFSKCLSLDTLIHVGVMQASNSIRIEKLVCLSIRRKFLIEVRT